MSVRCFSRKSIVGLLHDQSNTFTCRGWANADITTQHAHPKTNNLFIIYLLFSAKSLKLKA